MRSYTLLLLLLQLLCMGHIHAKKHDAVVTIPPVETIAPTTASSGWNAATSSGWNGTGVEPIPLLTSHPDVPTPHQPDKYAKWNTTYLPFQYLLFIHINDTVASSTPAFQNALLVIEDSIKKDLRVVLQAQNAKVVIDNIFSETLGNCGDMALQYQSLGYNACAQAQSKIEARLGPGMDADAVSRATLYDVRTMMAKFNDDHTGQIRVLYQYPITVSTTLILTMTNVAGNMGTNGQNLLIDVITRGFGPLMKKNPNPSYELVDLQVMVQQQGNFPEPVTTSRLLQAEPSYSTPYGVPFNRVQMFFRAACAGEDVCTRDNFHTFLVSSFTKYAPMLAVALRGNAESSESFGTHYFDVLNAITVDQSFSVAGERLNSTTMMQLNNENIGMHPPKNSMPWWVFWALIADGIIVGVALLYVIFIAYSRATEQSREKARWERAKDRHARRQQRKREKAARKERKAQEKAARRAEKERQKNDAAFGNGQAPPADPEPAPNADKDID